MNKGKLNFIIDAIMFVLMGIIAGLGLLIKYVLLSGTERWIKYGRSVDLTFWGLDRHEWGKIHLILAITLVVFLILHIIFHWKMTISLYKKLISNRSIRIFCALAFSLITLVLICFPFFIHVEIHEMASGKERYKSSVENAYKKEEKVNKKSELVTIKEHFDINKSNEEKIEHEHHHNIDPSIEVKGYMTLSEISRKYNIPEEFIKKELKLPLGVSGSEQLGHLRKQYGFKMSEIELIISNYKK